MLILLIRSGHARVYADSSVAGVMLLEIRVEAYAGMPEALKDAGGGRPSLKHLTTKYTL